jgi:hypothetical protein
MAPRSRFCQLTSNNEQFNDTSKANTALSLPRSDLGFSKVLLERKRQRRVTEIMVTEDGEDCSRRRTNDRPAQQSSRDDPFLPIIFSKDEIIVDNLGVIVYIVLYFGVSLVIVMLYLVLKGSWKGKMREVLDVLSSSNDAPYTLFCTKNSN